MGIVRKTLTLVFCGATTNTGAEDQSGRTAESLGKLSSHTVYKAQPMENEQGASYNNKNMRKKIKEK